MILRLQNRRTSNSNVKYAVDDVLLTKEETVQKGS
jgi:hypothetical protein